MTRIRLGFIEAVLGLHWQRLKAWSLLPFWRVAIFRVLVCTLADIAAFPYISCGPLFVRSAMVTKVCFICKKTQGLGLKARGGSRCEGLRQEFAMSADLPVCGTELDVMVTGLALGV